MTCPVPLLASVLVRVLLAPIVPRRPFESERIWPLRCYPDTAILRSITHPIAQCNSIGCDVIKRCSSWLYCRKRNPTQRRVELVTIAYIRVLDRQIANTRFFVSVHSSLEQPIIDRHSDSHNLASRRGDGGVPLRQWSAISARRFITEERSRYPHHVGQRCSGISDALMLE